MQSPFQACLSNESNPAITRTIATVSIYDTHYIDDSYIHSNNHNHHHDPNNQSSTSDLTNYHDIENTLHTDFYGTNTSNSRNIALDHHTISNNPVTETSPFDHDVIPVADPVFILNPSIRNQLRSDQRHQPHAVIRLLIPGADQIITGAGIHPSTNTSTETTDPTGRVEQNASP